MDDVRHALPCFAPAAGRPFYRQPDGLRADYFLRKRSSRTTSAPSLGLAGSSSVSAASAGTARAEEAVEVAGTAGRLVAAASVASAGSNCRPNCTEGSKKFLMELKGTTRRSG